MSKKIYIGLGVTYHDPALAIVDENGEVLFAEAGERYLQNKRALNCEPDNLYRLPELLDEFCPKAEQFTVAFNWLDRRPWYENTVSWLGVLSAGGLLRPGPVPLISPLETYKLHHMMACQRNSMAQGGINLVRILRERFANCTVHFKHFEHHACHAAMACYASPFADSACAVIDSFGEKGSLAFYHYDQGKLKKHHESKGTGSLGLYFMKLTELCGFDWLKGEEWKVMGLAAYGKLDEELYGLLKAMLKVEGLNLKHPKQALAQSLKKIDAIKPSNKADLAFTGQTVFNQAMREILNCWHEISGNDNLALAGGCALNSSFNGLISSQTPFKQIYVPPAPADDGTALGAAWLAYHSENAAKRPALLSPYLGSTLSKKTLSRFKQHAAGLKIIESDDIYNETAQLIAQGKLIAWVQGRAEFGPRALGNRSILADPRDPEMKNKINQRVKFREEYRPFAPSILHEFGADYFEDYVESPYMERALRFKPDKKSQVPAVVHADGTGRLQTVKPEWNERFYKLILAFHRLTGVPILLNTSFNVMGKPIVHSVEDAISVLMTSGLDGLVIGDSLFLKPDTP